MNGAAMVLATTVAVAVSPAPPTAGSVSHVFGDVGEPGRPPGYRDDVPQAPPLLGYRAHRCRASTSAPSPAASATVALGTTTLGTYTAWLSEADQRAAVGIGSGMPTRPVEVDETERQQTAPRSPYEKVAAAIRQRVLAGEFTAGESLPPEKALCAEHEVSLSTVRRATALLRSWSIISPAGRYVVAPARDAGT